MRQTGFFLGAVIAGLVVVTAICTAEAAEKSANLEITSSLIGARVYVDDTYKGDADLFIENVIPGEHTITCRAAGQTVSDTFTVRAGETLKIKALFESGKIVDILEAERVEAERKKKELQAKTDAEKQEAKARADAKAEAKRLEDQKKKAEEAKRTEEQRKSETKRTEVTRTEQKNSAEERRELHLNIVKFYIEDSEQDIVISHKMSQKIISKFAEQKKQTGKYYKTKKDVLLCDSGICVKDWSTSFSYTDDAGRTDAFTVSLKETVFNGLTPSGTSKRDVNWCVNGACKKLEDTDINDKALQSDMDRFTLVLTKSSITIRRSDIAQEIIAAGKSLADYQ